MRTWSLPARHSGQPDHPMPSSAQQRGLCLMAVEFLTRYPTSECVVTSASLGFWDTVFDLFPKTLFHVFCCPVEDPPRPNVIRHGARFDSDLAGRFGARGAPYNLMMTSEDMDLQMALYLRGAPSAALLLVKRPPQEYLEGELVYPIYCAPDSCLCGLVPLQRASRAVPYAGYCAAMRDFHARAAAGGYACFAAAEDAILGAYVRSVSGVENSGSAWLLEKVTRTALPELTEKDVVFWEPQAQDWVCPQQSLPEPVPGPLIRHDDVIALLALFSEKQIDPNGLVAQGI